MAGGEGLCGLGVRRGSVPLTLVDLGFPLLLGVTGSDEWGQQARPFWPPLAPVATR